jgi:hypothetical protein
MVRVGECSRVEGTLVEGGRDGAFGEPRIDAVETYVSVAAFGIRALPVVKFKMGFGIFDEFVSRVTYFGDGQGPLVTMFVVKAGIWPLPAS